MPSRRNRSIVVVLALAAACSRGETPGSPPAPAPAKGGGEVIATYDHKQFTTDDFKRELERLPPRSRTQLTATERRHQFVENYIMNDLLADEGATRGYDRDPEIASQVDQLRRRLIVQRVMKDYQEPPPLTDDEARAYYEQNKRMFSGGQVRASHILVKDEDLAKRLREELRRDPSKFQELAKANSIDTATAARGGDLGFFGQGRMVAEFERAAFALQNPGDITEVVKTPFGYHIIELTDRKEGEDKPFDEVKDRIRIALLNTRRQERVNNRFEELRKKAGMKIDDAVLAKVEIPGEPESPPAGGPAGRDDARKPIMPVPPRPTADGPPAPAPAPPGP